jgi:hypothetical protein
MGTSVSDDVFDTVINAISPYGPIGIIVVLLIIGIVIMAVSLRKSLKHWINMKADNQMAQKESILRRDEQDQAARQRREERDASDRAENAKQMGMLAELQHQSMDVIQRNTDAFAKVVTEINVSNGHREAVSQSIDQMGARLDSLDDDVRGMKDDLLRSGVSR